MYDLDTIKRINRNPSANRQDKPAPQPTREDSLRYGAAGRRATMLHRCDMQSPARDREPLDNA